MEAIILAGGQGTRLRQVVNDRPKVLAPVNGRPFLHYQLELLANCGIKRVILATGYLSHMVRTEIGNEFAGLQIDYSEEMEPLGTGGALAQALNHCRKAFAFVFNGDTWLGLNASQLTRIHIDSPDLAMTGVFRTDTGRYGRLQIKNGQVTRLEEKKRNAPGYINAGMYFLHKDIFANSRLPTHFSLECDFLPVRLACLPASFYELEGEFWDIGTPEDYQSFSKLLED